MDITTLALAKSHANKMLDDFQFDIPQGGGGGYFEEHILAEAVSQYAIPLNTAKYKRYTISVHQTEPKVLLQISTIVNGLSSNEAVVKDASASETSIYSFELVRTGGLNYGGEYIMVGHSRRNNNTTAVGWFYAPVMYVTQKTNGFVIYGQDGAVIPAGTKIWVRCWE